ncbi:NUDIX hydrolase [Kordiimonas lacus]|uniref:ADP-ribose pyrophosphatase YjhB, NUDIX family n=1 Tax=Kordiimonas lacus TaxID=637679 RepID=A0A1G6U0X8_9PROT|nr:NUDIX hydrolase [Kordiimonas lacus]SDD34988.1 ADP-ribose pyrophosphatase YjhB, NUDIX family [Kordiimonas lacus]
MANTPKAPKNFHHTVPEGDERERLVCRDCGFIAYENPRIIAGSVVEHDGKILLCKRAIFPQKGKWTIPAGFLEVGESPDEGAAREAYEEAMAHIEIRDLLAVYSVRHISQVHMMYRATLKSPDFAPGIESQEVGLFAWDDIPWDELAFPSVHWVLGHYREAQGKSGFAPFTNPV